MKIWGTNMHFKIAKLTKNHLEWYCREEGDRLEIYNKQ